MNQNNHGNAGVRAQEQGFVLLLAMVAAVLPLVLILGATSTAMQGKLSRLEHEIDDERMLVAAESGIDEAIYRASTSSGLSSGTSFTRTFTDGASYTVTPTYLRSDHVDNDGDAAIDEADEDIFQILVVGTYRGQDRRLVAYLGPDDPPITTVPGAVVWTHIPAGQELHVQGASDINGHDHLVTGALGPAANDAPGVAAVAPATLAQLTNLVPSADRPKITGLGATPSLAITTTTYDFPATRLAVQNAASRVLTSATYNNLQFGNGLANNYIVTYRNGNLDLRGNTTGAGILFVNGNFHVEGRFQFHGIIFVTGDVEIHGTSTNIYGGMIMGPAAPHFYLEGTAHAWYSRDAVSRATAMLPTKYLAFNGWQEISRD